MTAVQEANHFAMANTHVVVPPVPPVPPIPPVPPMPAIAPLPPFPPMPPMPPVGASEAEKEAHKQALKQYKKEAELYEKEAKKYAEEMKAFKYDAHFYEREMANYKRDMERHKTEAKRYAAEAAGHREQAAEWKITHEMLQRELLKDNLIEPGQKDLDVRLDKSGLYIKGEKQSEELYQKYKKLLKINKDNSNFHFRWNQN
ncbi:MAG: hypothetical protein LPK19_17190 [Hymenobacteraceae bacterium]|nr:hypothetical protein [Hymenobacteraceae bacterium]MDX5397989.1 hypothetical protein [Hymenobacteraceae bacterium]MDX5514061.1 hypothetical protein [Hymenobacteraceae bacterium]